MDKSTLTSINPPHTDNIFLGKKSIEWRTKPMPTGKHYCYETKKHGGVGKVIGEYWVWRIKRYENVSLIPEFTIENGCVSVDYLTRYSKGKPLYAHFIIMRKRYDKPRELREYSKYGFGRFVPWKRPPQSWGYVAEYEQIHNTEYAAELK